jgi:hypothetical protein
MHDGRDVWLYTSWPVLNYDLMQQGLKCVRMNSPLWTQAKNEAREATKFVKAPTGVETTQLKYWTRLPTHMDVTSTVLDAIFRSAGLTLEDDDTFEIPVPFEWQFRLDDLLEQQGWRGQPMLVYRPLTKRPEARMNDGRNPDPQVYHDCLAQIREQFFVVSVADLLPGREWIVGPQVQAEATFHGGLPIELLVALFARASLAYVAAGFGAILSPAVKTPVISVVGNEPVGWLNCSRTVPYLGIAPPYTDAPQRCKDFVACIELP